MLPITHIRSDQLSSGSVPLSHAVKAGGFVFVSGMVPHAKDGFVAEGDLAAQVRQVMANMKAVLEQAGSSFDKVVKVNVFLARASDFPAMNEIYREYFPEGKYPARTTVQAPLANPDFLVEMECVAVAGD